MMSSMGSGLRAGSVAIRPGRQAGVTTDDATKAMIEALRRVIKRMDYALEVMMTCVRWYVAYPLNLRHFEEMMTERGVSFDASAPWARAGAWTRPTSRYLYRAVDRDGGTVDFLLTARRDEAAARRFFEGAIDQHGRPETITIDKSGANTAAIGA
jgi:putative transposase